MNTYYITGGTGSLGEALIKHILGNKLGQIKVISHDATELDYIGAVYDVGCVLCDIRDCNALQRTLESAKFIIHCAAVKFVPECEQHPLKAVQTNVMGAANVIQASQTPKVIAISSDKAVHPANVYGATKLIMERMFLSAGYSCIRFGNFWGSRGSVVPIFKEQSSTGILPITDPEMKRYWIGLEEAAEFVLKCLGMMRGNEVFVPKMQERGILEIADGINPEAEIKFIGRRLGEKLREDLFFEFEKPIDKGDYWEIDYR